MFIKSSRGYSLLELSVAMALLGGISLVTMRIVEEQKGNETYIKARTEIEKAMSILRATLADDENCRQMIAGRLLRLARCRDRDRSLCPGNTQTLFLPLRGKRDASGRPIGQEFLNTGKAYDGFSVKRIDIFGTSINITPYPKQATVRLQIYFEVKSRNLANWSKTASKKTIIETITIEGIAPPMSMDVVSDCRLLMSEANSTAKEKFCKSLGAAAVWDATNKKCTFSNNMSCPANEVMVKMNSLGGIVCKPIKDAIKLDELFDTTSCQSTGKFRIVEQNGKLKIECPP